MWILFPQFSTLFFLEISVSKIYFPFIKDKRLFHNSLFLSMENNAKTEWHNLIWLPFTIQRQPHTRTLSNQIRLLRSVVSNGAFDTVHIDEEVLCNWIISSLKYRSDSTGSDAQYFHITLYVLVQYNGLQWILWELNTQFWVVQ